MFPSIFARGNRKTLQNLKKLRKQAQAEKQPKVALRIQGIMLSLEKHSVNDIARLLHVHRTTVRLWIHAWNTYHEQGVLEGYRSGRRPKLTDNDKETLYDIVDSGPVAYGSMSLT